MKIKYDNMSNIREIRAKLEESKKANQDQRVTRGDMAAKINSLHPASVNVKVKSITEVTSTSKCIRFVADDDVLPYFRAGQYINVKVNINGIRTSRSYTLSSPPSERGYYEITVRRKPAGGFVSDYLLDDLKVGDKLEISGPSGSFYYRRPLHGDDLVFLAGGSGITPFLSMIRYWNAENVRDKKVTLIYGSNHADDVIYLDELKELEKTWPGFKLHLVISDPEEGYQGLTGFINADLIRRVVGDVTGKRFFLCGPDAMHHFVKPELGKLGISKYDIDGEGHAPADATKLPDWPAGVSADDMVTVQIEDGISFQAPAGEPLLNSLERNGVVLLSKCRVGECAYCRTKLLSGNVVYPKETWIRKADVANSIIHPCVAFPTSDVVLRVYTVKE